MSAAIGMQIPTMAPGASSLSLALPHSNPPGSTSGVPYYLSSELSGGLSRIKLVDILPDDGAPTTVYSKAVESLSNSLTRNNAAIIQLSVEDSALLRCALESAKLYFRTRAHSAGVNSRGGANHAKYYGYISAPSRDMYLYRAGRTLEEGESSPPCMADVFRCLGKASRASLSAITRHLRLRSDVFHSLLDDLPLPANEVSSSVLVATYFHSSVANGKGLLGDSKPSIIHDMEKGLLTLIASDSPVLQQVCDPNGRWYLADSGLRPGELMLLTGRALCHTTAGLRRAASYRWVPNLASGSRPSGRTSMAFKLMPRANAILSCSPISDAGHVIPQGYRPISVRQFMDGLAAVEVGMGNVTDNACETRSIQNLEPSLRSVLSDPLSGGFLEDAMVAQCGHSFGGSALKRVRETARCTTCGTEVDAASMIPNFALRAAAAAVKCEENRRLLQNAAIRKRRKEAEEQGLSKDNAGLITDKDSSRQSKGVQYPFAVDERVMIKGNKRTPDKFVGREAIVTSQCLNGWYLLKTLDSGESVRLQYRSLQKIMLRHNDGTEDCVQSQHSSQING